MTMTLSAERIERFDRDGYLFFPSLFTSEEIARLTEELPALFAEHRPENVREKGSDAARTSFAAHMSHEAKCGGSSHGEAVMAPLAQTSGSALDRGTTARRSVRGRRRGARSRP